MRFPRCINGEQITETISGVTANIAELSSRWRRRNKDKLNLEDMIAA